MEMQTMNMHETIEMRQKRGRAVVACGLWVRAGLIGASGFAAGVLLLLGGEMKPLTALALAIAGGALAAVSWRRARAVLDAAEEAPTTSAVVRLRAAPTLRTAGEGAR
jgi:hypothetical protein